MCAVSMMYTTWTNPTSTNYVYLPSVDPTLAQKMLDVLKKLEEIDRKLGLMEQCQAEAKDKQNFKRKLRRIANRGKD